MNTPDTGNTPEDIVDTPAQPAVQDAPPPPPQVDNRRRQLRDLLSIPERDRTDAQWDEIIELEIQLAPGNRIAGNERPHGGGQPGGGGGGGQGRSGGGGQKKQRQQQQQPRQQGQGQGQGTQGGGKRRSRGNKPSGGGQAA